MAYRRDDDEHGETEIDVVFVDESRFKTHDIAHDRGAVHGGGEVVDHLHGHLEFYERSREHHLQNDDDYDDEDEYEDDEYDSEKDADYEYYDEDIEEEQYEDEIIENKKEIENEKIRKKNTNINKNSRKQTRKSENDSKGIFGKIFKK